MTTTTMTTEAVAGPRPRSRPARRVKPMDVVLVWHGLFAGSWAIAYLSAESGEAVHQFAGYTALALLAVRLLAASLATEKSVWNLPWAPLPLWQAFLGRLGRGDLSVLRSRTPFTPLSALAVLGVMALTVPTGLMADWFDADDLHEGIAEASLTFVLIHVVLVSLPPFFKWLRKRRA